MWGKEKVKVKENEPRQEPREQHLGSVSNGESSGNVARVTSARIKQIIPMMLNPSNEAGLKDEVTEAPVRAEATGDKAEVRVEAEGTVDHEGTVLMPCQLGSQHLKEGELFQSQEESHQQEKETNLFASTIFKENVLTILVTVITERINH